jgi:hypothetical protein
MKKIIVSLAVIALLAAGTIVYAHGGGYWGGGHMMGSGYGGHMMGWRSPGQGFDHEFLNETTDLRRELHDKRFEYAEALRNTDTSSKTIAKFERTIRDLQEKIAEKAPRTAYGYGGMRGGFCW